MSRVYVFTQYGGPETEELRERPVPEPGPGQILVKVRAAGVNPADLKLREGQFGRSHTMPRTLGFEVSGVVAAVGPDVEGYAVGEAVLGPVAPGEGGFADHALLRAKDAVAKPEDVSFEVAATVPVAGTAAYDLTHQVELEEGQTMLVLGAGGGVGHMACEIGRVHRFRVIGVASEAKREIVESTGATWVASGDGAAGAVRELAPDGVDLLVDLVGGQPLRDLAPLVTSPDRIVSAADEQTATELGGSGRANDPEALEKIVGVVGHGVLTPEVAAVFPLDRAGEALAAVAEGHSRGKTVIVP
ncbi:NADP-dependent oxidoreductase [Ornithinimicrobium avium]|uniref:NADP-dependent oxidoreductase n=1 Tax=Ornithinimicrobium avium TaxID=2283195 RepID=A0A345NPL1_9MICO|nr:NADP-dependent oxidoreductase [Ornithinimicrobium avium]AXH96969.1 NADP-dependent oxidoreductase [Ornithinimicrobium avium]